MYQFIYNTLHRQQQAMRLLDSLITEEYNLLLDRKTQEVVALEFSIHELIRQMAMEKASIIRLLNGCKIMTYAQSLPQEQGQVLLDMFQEIDNFEQSSSKQASLNARLSLALLDQSQRTMQALHQQFTPKAQTYGKRGIIAHGRSRPQAMLFSGRM